MLSPEESLTNLLKRWQSSDESACMHRGDTSRIIWSLAKNPSVRGGLPLYKLWSLDPTPTPGLTNHRGCCHCCVSRLNKVPVADAVPLCWRVPAVPSGTTGEKCHEQSSSALNGSVCTILICQARCACWCNSNMIVFKGKQQLYHWIWGLLCEWCTYPICQCVQNPMAMKFQK